MGLLSRIACKENVPDLIKSGAAFDPGEALDEIGEALAERIARLPRSPSRAESALNLLKPYISFQAGFCAVLERERYVPYAVVGIDPGEAGFDKKDVVLSERGLEKLSLPFSPYQTWAFDLGNSSVLFLRENPANPFTVLPASSLLEKIRTALLPVTNRGQDAGENAGASGIEGFVSAYYRDKGPFRGLVLGSAQGEAGLLQALEKVLSSARITQLTPDTCLILYPKPLSEKLIAHRLKESFGVKVLFSFEASGVTEALNCIENYRKT
jgi:hypothetical protein